MSSGNQNQMLVDCFIKQKLEIMIAINFSWNLANKLYLNIRKGIWLNITELFLNSESHFILLLSFLFLK